ncbi:Hypothetical protein PHPALM_3831 [Phytophthora palmivora]|uniref:Uncharacterized protein n=1 Tax=Phytophthora palmivora TaxID=4796 RepID=A0A2P4YLC3_9STRA|nr:Hypothetical protein PHPALM_3831 [Phytophthora palmivora]
MLYSLMKWLLWKKTSIDTMVASLLKHQITVIDQVLVEIQRHGLRSRSPPTIPNFLYRISARMSNFVLKEYVVDNGKRPLARKESLTLGSVCQFTRIHVWRCCMDIYLFILHIAASIMSASYVCAREGHGFEELPPLALDNRWNMDCREVITGTYRESQVAFVRLAKSERCEHIVLMHAEKHNITRSMLDPLIDRLTRLSSAKFYKQVQV